MLSFVHNICGKTPEYSSGEEVVDDDAVNLSHIGTAAYEVLRKKHNWHHHTLWNVTSGQIVGNIHQTPLDAYGLEDDPPEGNDDWFPEKLCEIISRTEVWCDVMSLGPPDGLFMEKFNEALKNIADRAQPESPVNIRLMFGHIVGMPVNCTVVLRKLTEGIPEDANIRVWVGAWRKGVSWNHAKIIAVDGWYLHTGGHNLWDAHYLKNNPVHDLSLEMEGRCAHDGHLFANEQWDFIETCQSTKIGQCVERYPDALPLVSRTRVTISEFPKGVAGEFPPRYKKRLVPMREKMEGDVPVITMGRYGSMVRKDRPSDDAIMAMLDSAQTIVRMVLQDLGPVCVPGTKITIPGCIWPKKTLAVLGRVLWEKGVDVEIVLSNPGSIPGGLDGTEACYGNGWSCVDVAAEIIKAIRKQYPDAEDEALEQKIAENLRICFTRHAHGKAYADGNTIGMHSKHFIIDDVCTYIGSQNLYICDLAEWGVVIDDQATTQQIIEEYWAPTWQYSYTGEDVDVQEVMSGLDVDRDGEQSYFMSDEQQMALAARHESHVPTNTEFYDKSDDEEESKCLHRLNCAQ